MSVLIGCEFSGVVREAFRARGIDAVSCDLLPSEIPGSHIQDDILKHMGDGWDGFIGHPPCTHTAVSGARWFKDKLPEQKKAIEFFMALWNSPIPRVALEQPVSIMSTVFRPPDQIIQPWMFGDAETKATCLWIRGWPILRPTNIVPEAERKHSVWLTPPGPDRWRIRSKTFEGIANAMADQWGTSLRTEPLLTSYMEVNQPSV